MNINQLPQYCQGKTQQAQLALADVQRPVALTDVQATQVLTYMLLYLQPKYAQGCSQLVHVQAPVLLTLCTHAGACTTTIKTCALPS